MTLRTSYGNMWGGRWNSTTCEFGYGVGAEFISVNSKVSKISRDTLFLFWSFPRRPFPSADASETPQERLNVSETSADGKDHDTVVEQ